MTNWEDKAIAALAVSLVAFLALLFVASYHDSKQPHFSLKKSDWKCTDTRETSYTTFMKVGDINVPQTHHTTVCTQWTERKIRK